MRFGRALFVLWAVFVFAGFLASRPFPNGRTRRIVAVADLPAPPAGVPGPSAAALPESWGDNARAVGWAALVAAAAWGAGLLLAPFLRLPMVPSAAVPAAAGLVACGTGVFGLGLAGLVFPSIIRLSALAFALRSLPLVARWRPSLPVSRGWGFAAGVVVAGFWALAAFNPEPGIDAYLYHLRLPFIYLLHHRVHNVWHHIHSHVPQVWELLLTAVPPSDAATTAQILSALCIIPIASMTLAFGGGGGDARLAVLLLVSSPLLVSIGTSAYTDLPLVWLGAASFFLLVQPHAAPSAARRFAAGAVLGAACALKYSAFPVVAAAGAWLIAVSVRRGDWRWGWPAACGFLAVFSPWMLWNWLAAGNPVDPFLGRLFPHALPALPFADRLSGAILRRPLRDLFASAWSAYVASEPFLFVSPWLVAAAPALFMDLRAVRTISGSGLWLVVCAGAWAVLIADERFLLPAAPLIAGLLARGGYLRMPRAAAAALLALNLAAVARQVFVPLPRLWTSLGLVSRPAYLRGTLLPAPGYAEAAAWLNARTDPRDRVLVISDCKSHLIWRECITDHVMDYPTRLVWILWQTPTDPGRIAARFHQLGIGWVLHLPDRVTARLREMPDLFEFRPGEAIAYGRFWETHARRAWAGPGASIWSVEARGHAPADVPDLPGVREVMEFSARLMLQREGPAAVVAEVRRYAAAYPRVGAVHRLAGEVLTTFGADAFVRQEGRLELDRAGRIDALAAGAR